MAQHYSLRRVPQVDIHFRNSVILGGTLTLAIMSEMRP